MYRGIILAILFMFIGQGCVSKEPDYIEVKTDEAVFEERLYYEQLDEEEQEIYKEIYEGILTQKAEFNIRSSDPEKANEILLAVMYDSPELFWIDGGAKATTKKEGNSTSYTILEPDYIYSKKEIQEMQKEIDAISDEILASISEDSTEYEKIKYVYEYLIENAEYTIGAQHSQNMYSALVKGETVCAGYAKANQYLLNELGVFCTYVTGTAKENGEEDSHAWNIVRCNDKYYYVDITWADPMVPEGNENITTEISYDYLCCSENTIAETHSLEKGYTYPKCDSDDLNYYRMHEIYYESAEYNDLLEIAKDSIDKKETTTIYKFASKELYAEAKKIMESKMLDAAARYLCEKHGLRQVNYQYVENEKVQKIVIYWSYE